MTIREFIRALWFGRWLVIASIVAVVLGATFYQSRQVTIYSSSAVVEFTASSQGGVGADGSSPLSINTNPAVVSSGALANAAASALGRPDEANTLVSQVTGAYTGDGERVIVTATSTDPGEAQAVANAFAVAYVEHLGLLWGEQLVELDDRLQTLRESYGEISARLAQNPDDPFATVEAETVIDQYQALSAQKSSAELVATPGWLASPASSSVALGFGLPTVLGVAALVGLIAGIGLAFARTGLDMRVRSAADASRLARGPVIAELKDVRGAIRVWTAKSSARLPVSSRVATPFTESIRELRTSAQVALGDGERSPIVVVTSADPDAPRAFLTANLAASWALSGRSTVVVGGDLRRPQLGELLPPPEGWEAPTIAEGQPLFRPTQVHNLELCLLPEQEVDPADYLASAGVRNLIDALRDRADVVVIDAPPVLAAADATILGGYGDGAIVVVMSGRTDREVLASASDRLRAGNVAELGVAFAAARGRNRLRYASTYGEIREDERTVPRGLHARGSGEPAEDTEGSTDDGAPAVATGTSELPDGAEGERLDHDTSEVGEVDTSEVGDADTSELDDVETTGLDDLESSELDELDDLETQPQGQEGAEATARSRMRLVGKGVRR